MHVAGMSHAGTRTKKELIAKSHFPILLEQHFSVKCMVYADIDEQCHKQTVRNKRFPFFLAEKCHPRSLGNAVLECITADLTGQSSLIT